MEEVIKGILIGAGAVILLGLLSLVSGTIVFWICPIAIPAAFPGLVESGVLASSLLWWQAVCLTWLFSILIKATQTNNNN